MWWLRPWADAPAIAIKPVVEIDSKTAGIHTIISPRKSFYSVELAEERGIEIAHEWIEEKSEDSVEKSGLKRLMPK